MAAENRTGAYILLVSLVYHRASCTHHYNQEILRNKCAHHEWSAMRCDAGYIPSAFHELEANISPLVPQSMHV
jgi:hypothetical protein